MSSWSLVGTKLPVKFSFGSCAILIENIDDLGYVRVASWWLTLSVLRVSVRGLPGHFFLVEAKMHVKVSCWVTFAWRRGGWRSQC